ncbi:MAG TPA: hypothetical protein PKA82_07955 [Pyrinomonadaceae bacterium]|jgi:hypothetical protein|nr:hypothetical protein [Pyrinomonadaceae bacterium]
MDTLQNFVVFGTVWVIVSTSFNWTKRTGVLTTPRIAATLSISTQ